MPGAIRVILIENDVLDLRIVRRKLELDTTNFILETENCLQRAVEAMRSSTFDLALLDLGLPDSYGIDSVKRVVEEFDQLAIIVLSRTYDEALAKEAFELGIKAFLTKCEQSANQVIATIFDVVKQDGKFARQNSNLLPSSKN